MIVRQEHRKTKTNNFVKKYLKKITLGLEEA